MIYRPVRLRGVPGVALLAAYGDDIPPLLSHWAGAIRQVGVHVVHVVTSPASPLRDVVRQIGVRWTAPRSRHPYHLIARALRDECPPAVLELRRWDSVGGDIL